MIELNRRGGGWGMVGKGIAPNVSNHFQNGIHIVPTWSSNYVWELQNEPWDLQSTLNWTKRMSGEPQGGPNTSLGTSNEHTVGLRGRQGSFKVVRRDPSSWSQERSLKHWGGPNMDPKMSKKSSRNLKASQTAPRGSNESQQRLRDGAID